MTETPETRLRNRLQVALATMEVVAEELQELEQLLVPGTKLRARVREARQRLWKGAEVVGRPVDDQ